MKKIILFVFLMIFSLGYSQDLLLGFEPGESGSVGAAFGDFPAPVVETGTGTNTTQVLKLVGNTAGQPWQGVNLTLTSLVNLTTTKTMTMDVYSDTAITFLVKVTGGVGGPAITAASASHPGGSTWQTISFTFNTELDGQPTPANGIYSGFVIHAYWAPGAVGFFNPTVPTPARTFYVDNIKGPLGTPPVIPAPTTAAPTPPNRPAADVKAVFTDAPYPNVGVLGYSGGDDNTYNTSWCGASTSLVVIDGNNTNKITGLGCEGISFLAGRFDANEFTRFHMDIWTPEPTTIGKVFSFKFSNWNGTTGETNAFEYTGNSSNFLTPGSEGTWISIDIPMTSLNCINTPPGNSCPSKNDFVQFVITSNLGTVYYDNIYLHKNTTLGTADFDTSNVKLYPNPATNVLNIESAQTIEKVTIYNLLGQSVISQTPNTELVTLDVESLQVGVYIVKTSINGNVSSTRFIKE
ncbi:T9SS type A sorting domain-containing protein [Flavobacterium sp. RSB2_4_14]|uniref:T9SS type A sorting domain-containing protein n=1 Tax=Flavobacterium sp. RSB2_4_14 TaxID=3447665 RepID=UPI003F2C0232